MLAQLPKMLSVYIEKNTASLKCETKVEYDAGAIVAIVFLSVIVFVVFAGKHLPDTSIFKRIISYYVVFLYRFNLADFLSNVL